jgi:hypothetical protein
VGFVVGFSQYIAFLSVLVPLTALMPINLPRRDTDNVVKNISVNKNQNLEGRALKSMEETISNSEYLIISWVSSHQFV